MRMSKVVSPAAVAATLTDHWSPRVVAEVDDSYVKVAKVKGNLTWHSHDGEDELFLVLQGKLRIEMEDRTAILDTGELFVVPRGVRHNPIADEECHILLFERKSTAHTGEVIVDRTRSIDGVHSGNHVFQINPEVIKLRSCGATTVMAGADDGDGTTKREGTGMLGTSAEGAGARLQIDRIYRGVCLGRSRVLCDETTTGKEGRDRGTHEGRGRREKRRLRTGALYGACLALAAVAAVPAFAAQTNSRQQQCAALEATDLSMLMDAPTQITASKFVKSKTTLPEYCQVEGYVSPQVGFEMRLPSSNWNRKFVAIGSGGWGGRFNGDACNRYLRQGYACVVSDTGHKSRLGDGLWARHNLQAQVDFGYRATHVSTLAGKAIVERYYSKGPQRSYFIGCSGGGYEGLVEAQRFPWDFDGIIAGSPDMDELGWAMQALWSAKNFLDKTGQPILSSDDIQLLHRAVLAECDMDDGVKDGIISNPVGCHFDPSKLLCKAGKNAGCLTQSQVAAVKRIYAGPSTSAGYRISARGVLPGAELDWSDKVIGLGAAPDSADSLLRNMVYGASPEWKAVDFDFDRDYKRLGLGALYTDTNPDLRKFHSAGGKLIVYQGGNDIIEGPAVVDYYETTERTTGGRVPTQDFFRLFLVPGMNHCGGGVGAFAVDYFSYLEGWVEQDKAPDVMIGAHVSDAYLAAKPSDLDFPGMTPELKVYAAALGFDSPLDVAALGLEFPLDPAIPVTFTRPIYPYPDYAMYTGKGDVNNAENFERRAPPAAAP